MKDASVSLLVISDALVRECVPMSEALLLVEAAFAADARGQARTFPVMVDFLPEYQAMFGIKSGHLGGLGESSGGLGLKAGGYWQGNAERGLPSHQSLMLMFDPETGTPRALVAANAITSLRTGAAGGVAARHLAREGPSTVAVIGAGDQARMQVEALRLVRPLREVRVWSPRPQRAQACAREWSETGLNASAVSTPQQSVEGADIVVTTTPSREPLVMSEWVMAGAHINAMGSDARGKRELDQETLRRATYVTDKTKQCAVIGELQHALIGDSPGAASVHAELGEICAGMKPGRTSAGEVTVFDSTGCSFQDLVVAAYVIKTAEERGGAPVVRL